MNKEELLILLDEYKIKYEYIEHEKAYTMNDTFLYSLPHHEWIAKNILLQDDKGRNFYYFLVHPDKRLDLKKIRKELNTRPLCFAASDNVFRLLKLRAGSLTPFGLLEDKNQVVQFFIDEYFISTAMIGCHPLENNAMIYLKTYDLIQILKNHDIKINRIKEF